MDAELTPAERTGYINWLHSPSVSSRDEAEGILAYKISKALGTIPSRTLRALRGMPGQDPELVARIEAFVEAEPGIGFVPDGDLRRVTLTG